MKLAHKSDLHIRNDRCHRENMARSNMRVSPISQTDLKRFPWQMRALQHPRMVSQALGGPADLGSEGCHVLASTHPTHRRCQLPPVLGKNHSTVPPLANGAANTVSRSYGASSQHPDCGPGPTETLTGCTTGLRLPAPAHSLWQGQHLHAPPQPRCQHRLAFSDAIYEDDLGGVT